MENSPLELYETAYRLQSEGRVSEALKYYDALIREFPDSNECGYAVIQINRVKANDAAASISGSKGGGNALGTVAFLLCLLMMAGAGAGWYLLQEKFAASEKRSSLSARALSHALAGNDKEAIALLDEMKLLSPDDITPYELSAQIYRRAGKIDKARAEYEVFFSLNPDEREKSKPANELVPDAPAPPPAPPPAAQAGKKPK